MADSLRIWARFYAVDILDGVSRLTYLCTPTPIRTGKP